MKPLIHPDTWPHVSTLLDEALALPVEAREDWLKALDGDRVAYRDTLRELLSRAEGVETGDFLATLPRFTQVVSRGPLTELAAGDSIGPYRLISELGTGGMGAVWLAERADGTLKRKVALKLPRMVWAKGLAERMARERDILATLEHPNIARLYDAGVDQHGRPYLALEYVEGQPIDVYAKERGLGVRDKLNLLLQVCSAVAFAHSRLVVHRDLKPSNILVTADGQVRLLDFGIAKLMEGDSAKETHLTQLAGRALTLDYASPEQIKGEPIGTASDVYSVGVVAYELLTGGKPYKLKRGSAAELEAAIVAADVEQVSTRAPDVPTRRALRGDIDAILSVCMARSPARRYASIASLVDDLRRHLAGIPVTARPQSLWERAGRLIRRRPTESAVAASVLLALLGGLYAQAAVAIALAGGTGVALWQRRQALNDRDLAERERGRAEAAAAAERAAAQQAERQASRAEEVKRFALSLFELADTDRGAGIRTTALELLQQAGQRIDMELGEQPAVAFELKVALATSLRSLGARDEARKLLELLVGEGAPLPPKSAETVRARLQYADVLSDVGAGEQAMRQLLQAEREANDAGRHELLPEVLRNVALRLGRDGHYAESLMCATRAVEAAEPPEVSDLDRIRAWTMLAHSRFAARQPGAREAAEQAIRIGESMSSSSARRVLLEARRSFATGLLSEGHPLEAIEQLQILLSAQKELLGPAHITLYPTLQALSNAQTSAGDCDSALSSLDESWRVIETSSTGATLERAVNRFRCAVALETARRWPACVAAFDDCLALANQLEKVSPALLLAWRSGAAHALARHGALDDAELRVPSLSQHPPVDALDQAIRQRHLAIIRSLQGRHKEAVVAALAGLQASEAASPLLRAVSRSYYGWVLLRSGDAGKAEDELIGALQELTRRTYPTSPDLTDCRQSLALAWFALGRAREAAKSLVACKEAWEAQGADAREAARAAGHLSLALQAAGDHPGKADTLARHASVVLAGSQRDDDVTLLHCLDMVGRSPPA